MKPKKETKEQEHTLYIPYVKGISYKLHRLCRPLNIKVVKQTTNMLRSILTKAKRPIESKHKIEVIYSLPCECRKVYTGETGKTLTERLAEHRRAVRRMDNNNSLAVHVQRTTHSITWDKAEVIEQENNKIRKKIKEALRIQNTDQCLNMD